MVRGSDSPSSGASRPRSEQRTEPATSSRRKVRPFPGPVAVRNPAPDSGVLDRLATRGVPALSDSELLTLVLPGQAGNGTDHLARELLDTCGGVAGLLNCDFTVARAQGLDDQQAAAVLAAVELGRRLVSLSNKASVMTDPGMVARYLHLRHARVNQEVFGALFLDVHQRVVGEVECFRGILTRVVVDPRPILREALRRNANGIVLFHNHPSGDPMPSDEDLSFTGRMKEACEALNLDLLDHLILGGARWTSIRRIRPQLLSPAEP